MRYRWQVLRAGPLRLDGGGMFGIIPRTIWNKTVPTDEQGRIELAHNCLLLEPVSPAAQAQTLSSPGERKRLEGPRSSEIARQPEPAGCHRSRGDDLAPQNEVWSEKRILIEVGSGNKFDEKHRRIYGLSDRWIADALREAKISPEEIGDVIVTHLHFDHAGGLTQRGRGGEDDVVRTFPNAAVHVQRREWDDALANRSTMTRTYLRENLEPIREQLRLVDSPPPFQVGYRPDRNASPPAPLEERTTSILPGIEVFIVPGHTWGQQAVRFKDERGRTIVFSPDIIPTAAHVGAAYNMAYDVEPYISTVTRRWFLKEAAEKDWLLVLDHEPGEPRRRARPDGKGWYDLIAESD